MIDETQGGAESSNPNPQTIIINRQPNPTNSLGTAGFVLAIIGFFLSWIPVLGWIIGLFFSWMPVVGWIIWILGLIFSFCGIFKAPKGLAIAGLVISLIDLIILIVIASSIMVFFV